MVFLALSQGGQERDVLRYVQQVFTSALGDQDVLVHLAAAALRHPIAKLHHIGPFDGGDLRAVFGVVQMLFVGHVGQPGLEKHQGVFRALGVFCPKL